jgi:hypothetical protein
LARVTASAMLRPLPEERMRLSASPFRNVQKK